MKYRIRFLGIDIALNKYDCPYAQNGGLRSKLNSTQ